MLGTEGYISAGGMEFGVLRPYALAVICDMAVNEGLGGGYVPQCMPSLDDESPGMGAAAQLPEGGVGWLYGE